MHGKIFSTVVRSLENLLDILVRAYTMGGGSSGPRVWNESPMMSWMRALMTMEEDTVAMAKNLLHFCNQLENELFWMFSSIIRFGVSIYYVV